VTEQLALFDNLSLATQQTLVEQTLAELAILEESFTAMKTAWQSGDVESFEQFLMASLAPYPEVQTVLFTQRNQDWLTQIESMLNQPEDYLIVVGAGHLVGEEGLVMLFQRHDYVVRQR
jgi:uncharacterized protein YbaP (TraB family)